MQHSRGSNKAYYIIGTFDSKEELENEIKENHTHFVSSYNRKTKDGHKYFYRCRYPAYRGPQCSTGLYYFAQRLLIARLVFGKLQ